VLQRHDGQTQVVDGLAWPAWLIADGADASSEAVYGLTAYVGAGGGDRAARVLRRLVDVASGRGGRVRATVAPGGFTIIRTSPDRGPT
jgi:hypothetical protein